MLMNKLNESDVRAARSEVVRIAQALASGSLPFLHGIRRLDALRFDVSPLGHDPDFTLFVAIASQADHLPSEEVRHLCTAAWLQTCDRDTRELEEFYRAQVKSQCEQLAQRFSKTA